jgi:hypothetical protein
MNYTDYYDVIEENYSLDKRRDLIQSYMDDMIEKAPGNTRREKVDYVWKHYESKFRRLYDAVTALSKYNIKTMTGYESPEAYAASFTGLKYYIRFGDLPTGGKSMNHFDKRHERGISSYPVKWNVNTHKWDVIEDDLSDDGLNTLSNLVGELEDPETRRPIYLIHGEETGHTGRYDQEPLLDSGKIKIVKKLSPKEIHSEYCGEIEDVDEAITYNSRKQNGGFNLYNKPLKDTDVLRLYHGFYDSHHAIEFCKYGVSGKSFANRNYSYESNNNPYGLFVTLDFNVAKQFSSPVGNTAVIIEFQTSANNLEAPIWPGGSYTVQGQYSQYWNGDTFKDKMLDRERGRGETKDKILQSTNPDLVYIKQSDRPELAFSLFNTSEAQALFIGDLNPNMIRAVWVYEGTSSPKHGTFSRFSVKDFLKKYEFKLTVKNSKSGNKVYKPNEEWSGFNDFVIRYAKHNDYDMDWVKSIVSDIDLNTTNGKRIWLHQMETSLWPKQLKQAIQDLKLDTNGDYYIP